MYQEKPVSVVVLAAGRGTRMKAELNKQYLPLLGVPILARTLQVLQDCRAVDHIVLVVTPGEESLCQRAVLEPYGITKVKRLVPGGDQRQASCQAGLTALKHICDHGFVLFQDGARPFLTATLVTASLEALLTYDACCVCVPVKDTIKVADETGCVKTTPPRHTLYAAQTPQGFRFSVAEKVFAAATAEGFFATDDAQLAERYGYTCRLVPGSYDNIKITTQEDLFLGENILKTRGVSHASGLSEPNQGN